MVVPLVDTLDRLLRVCGRSLEAVPRYGEGIDPTAIRELLMLTPRERSELARREATTFLNS